MESPSPARRIALTVAATIMLVLSASMAWATVNDYGVRVFVPNGVRIAGTDLSGMSEAQARQAIEQAVSQPLMRPLTINADGKSFSFDPHGAVSVDVDAMLESAFAPRRSAAFASRVRHDVGAATLPAEIEPIFSVDDEVVAEWVDRLAARVDSRAVDATVTVVDGNLNVVSSKTGRLVSVPQVTKLIADSFTSEAALGSNAPSITVPVQILQPKVTEKDLGKTIIVDLSERRIRLYNGAKIEKVYPCAIGTPSYPTPTGHFEIELKRYRPSWSNPAPNGWGKGMPAYIPPGPGNPLGTRAINLSAPGIRFHGTTKIGSVGTAASHGCMRMYRSDIEDLYERVEVGMQVYIVR